MILYTLKEREDTGEYHLFEAKKNKKGGCVSEDESICKKMKWRKEVIFSCKTEDEAREECAEIGRQVCGTCVSHLYATYD